MGNYLAYLEFAVLLHSILQLAALLYSIPNNSVLGADFTDEPGI
jgi:hypothetical protein